jgi:molybdate transport repressor ModE-like protein
MKIKVRISITNNKDEPFMGIGLVWLLEGVKRHKSINSAAKEMSLSYAKALKILNLLEKNLGAKVISRKRGGNKRYGAEITPFGEEYIKRYDAFQKKIKKYSEDEFKKFLKSNNKLQKKI